MVGGGVLFAVSFLLRDWTMLLASFATGLRSRGRRSPWTRWCGRRSPTDTADVFSVYGVVYNLARSSRRRSRSRCSLGSASRVPRSRGHRVPPMAPGDRPLVRAEAGVEFGSSRVASSSHPRASPGEERREPIGTRSDAAGRTGRTAATRLPSRPPGRHAARRPSRAGRAWRLGREDDRLPSDSGGSRIVSRRIHRATMNERSEAERLGRRCDASLALLSIVAGALIGLSDDDERASTPNHDRDPYPLGRAQR